MASTGKPCALPRTVMKYLEDHTDHSLGNFRFAAIANVPAYTPFFPASYHEGQGHQFAIALESANVCRSGRMAVPRGRGKRRDRQLSLNWEYMLTRSRMSPAKLIGKPDGPTWVSIFRPLL